MPDCLGIARSRLSASQAYPIRYGDQFVIAGVPEDLKQGSHGRHFT